MGDYDTDKSYKMQEARGGGKFNQSNSKSDLDWKIHHAAQSPGPGTYKSQAPNSQIKGGKISVANVKSGEKSQVVKPKHSLCYPSMIFLKLFFPSNIYRH